MQPSEVLTCWSKLRDHLQHYFEDDQGQYDRRYYENLLDPGRRMVSEFDRE